MFTSRNESRTLPEVIALVELDLQKMRVRFVLAREAIRERLRELEQAVDHYGEVQNIVGTTDNCRPEETQQRRSAEHRCPEVRDLI
jgi:hypothetical protein